MKKDDPEKINEFRQKIFREHKWRMAFWASGPTFNAFVDLLEFWSQSRNIDKSPKQQWILRRSSCCVTQNLFTL